MGFLTRISSEKFWATLYFWGHQICQQTVHKVTKFHSYFQLKSKCEGRIKPNWINSTPSQAAIAFELVSSMAKALGL